MFHAAALWALQSGLLRRVIEVIVPAEIISEMIEPPAPQTAQPSPSPIRKETPALQPPIVSPQAPIHAEPAPVLAPSSNSPVVVSAPVTPSAPSTTPSPSPAPTPPAAPAVAPKVEFPSSNAQYLQNPKPAYPAMSKRLGE